MPDRVHPRRLDVTDPADWRTLAEWADETFGRVDGLINNAGTTSRVPLTEVPLEEWNRTLGVNLTGPMLGVQTLAPLMGAGGSIANVGSVAGLTAHYAAYTAISGAGGSPGSPRSNSGRAAFASMPFIPATSRRR